MEDDDVDDVFLDVLDSIVVLCSAAEVVNRTEDCWKELLLLWLELMLSRLLAVAEGVVATRDDAVTSWDRGEVVEDAQWLVKPLETCYMRMETREGKHELRWQWFILSVSLWGLVKSVHRLIDTLTSGSPN